MIVSWFWLWYIPLTTAADMLFDSDICLKTWYNCVWGKWTNSCSAVFHLSHWITCSRSFVLASLLWLSLYHFLLTLKFLFKICKWTTTKNFKFAFLGLRLRIILLTWKSMVATSFYLWKRWISSWWLQMTTLLNLSELKGRAFMNAFWGVTDLFYFSQISDF